MAFSFHKAICVSSSSHLDRVSPLRREVASETELGILKEMPENQW
jgi:hypothetical protein